MELFILISCVLLLILNIVLIGLHVRSRKNNTTREISRSISDLEKVIRDESRYNRENDENRSRKDREELASTLNHFRTEHRETLKNITTQTNSAIQAFQKSFATACNGKNSGSYHSVNRNSCKTRKRNWKRCEPPWMKNYRRPYTNALDNHSNSSASNWKTCRKA